MNIPASLSTHLFWIYKNRWFHERNFQNTLAPCPIQPSNTRYWLEWVKSVSIIYDAIWIIAHAINYDNIKPQWLVSADIWEDNLTRARNLPATWVRLSDFPPVDMYIILFYAALCSWIRLKFRISKPQKIKTNATTLRHLINFQREVVQ